MATNFPTSLDSFSTKVDNVTSVLASHVNNLQDSVRALEAKIGVNSSAVTTSHDYILANRVVKVYGDQTIAGIKTFSGEVIGELTGRIGDTLAYEGTFTLLTAYTSIALEGAAASLRTIDEFSYDGTLADNSDTALPTEKAVKTYVDAMRTTIFNTICGIGCVYTSVVSTNPGTLFGFGTWVAFGSGRTLVGVDVGQTEFDTVEETGGAKTHTLSTAEMPAHTHDVRGDLAGSGSTQLQRIAGGTSFSSSSAAATTTGGGSAHNNLQPYITVYFFKRTA